MAFSLDFIIRALMIGKSISSCKVPSVSLTDIGEVTARILQFNNIDRLLERQILIANSDYPR